jgi:hypothetical protein
MVKRNNRSGYANMFSTARPTPETVTASRANGRPYMISSVRELLRARGTRCRCRVFRFSALAALSGYFGNDFSNNGVLLVISLITVLLAAGVVLPAVWSRKDFRRRAALAVLERLIRWPSVMPGSHLSRFPGLCEGPAAGGSQQLRRGIK